MTADPAGDAASHVDVTAGQTARTKRRPPAPRDAVLNPDDFGAGLVLAMKALNTKSVSRAKSPADVLPVCLRHNLRQDNADHRHRSPIAAERTADNTVLRGAAEVRVFVRTVRDTLDAVGARPPRNDTIMGVEYVFQPPDGYDIPDFWVECLRFLEERGLLVVSATVHRDQKRPHMHAIVLPIQGNKFVGSALTNGANRLEVQRSAFMAHMRDSLGLRPDRPAKPGALERLALSPGKGPRRHEEAERRDQALVRRAAGAARPHSPRDLIAPTSYCAPLASVERLFAEGVRKGHFGSSPARPRTPAPVATLRLVGAATAVADVRKSFAPAPAPDRRTFVDKHGRESEMDTGRIGSAGRATGGASEPKRPDAPKRGVTGGTASDTGFHEAKTEAAQNAEEAHGDFDPVAECERLTKEVDELQAQIHAAHADDLKAETMKWRRIAQVAERRQGELMATVNQRERELQWMSRQLDRIGRAVGESDRSKLAASWPAARR